MISFPLMPSGLSFGVNKTPKKVSNWFAIDKRKGLKILFSDKHIALQFASESISELILKKLDIKEIRHFSYANIESNDITQADHLLLEFKTFYDLVYIEEDELRFPGTFVEFKDGIKVHFDFNLSTIRANDIQSLFTYSSFVFKAFNYNMTECQDIIISNPGKVLRLFKRNRLMQFSYLS